ncbi:hypothetical protein P3S67_011039 [Capsicum chacoense]
MQLTGMENYALWSRPMKLGLLVKNKQGFIDGTMKRDDYKGKMAKKWDRCNAMVISWLTSNVSKHLLSGILFCSNAFQVWTDLKERCDKVDLARIYHLHREICTLTQGVSTISTYFSKLKDLWDEFDSIVSPPSCNCEKSRDYTSHLLNQRLLQFLLGLNEGYSQARSQILMMTPTPTVNQAYTMLIQDESQQPTTAGSYVGGECVEPTALFSGKHL